MKLLQKLAIALIVLATLNVLLAFFKGREDIWYFVDRVADIGIYFTLFLLAGKDKG
ncbi:TPA: hypothetical protein ACGOVU_000473 [Streptococcus suis]|uniref:hypothetical protein n=1 Tax=Streptococcus suis TaxID=1307 RepID=UPI00155758D7|nr:hypothetical protein [Streptococcus suis]MBY4975832.1 hypothetical protein [Streptococcus suis]MCK3859642.1 hypothetical protein [Streptococcus suis]MDG4501404.1 hypothetical protein [Streptococcus suis]MDG4508716.1 hypothetical protein [Streptococcus suis]MDG4510969.1 hypothetical protein [Streptococcus suis]